jgi:uncharacterized protein YwgA
MLENYKILAGIVEAHPNRQVEGRIRLHRTTRLLQRVGLPIDYTFSVHFDGPYSQELHSDLKMMLQAGLGTEECKLSRKGEEYFIIRATAKAKLALIGQFQRPIDLISAEDLQTLEFASTYNQYREMGSTHHEALNRVRSKIGSSFDARRTEFALTLLRGLGLPVGARTMRASA